MRIASTCLRLTVAGGLMAGAACTVGPNYVKPALTTPPAYVDGASTSRTAVTAADADLSRWWTQLGDPVLNDLIARALKDNPDLQTAALKVREAREQLKIAGAAELPTLSGSGNAVSFNSNRKSSSGAATSGSGATSGLASLPIPSHLSLYSAGFDASWEVDLFGGTRRSIEAAKDDAQAAEWARRDGQVSLAAEVANAYLTLRVIQVRTRLGQDELQRQQGLSKLVADRRKSGFVTQLDVNQQIAQESTAAAQIPALQAQARAQIHALGVLVGQPPDALSLTLQSVGSLPPQPIALPTGLPSELLTRRPDIREAERRLASANAAIGVQEAELYPKLNLMGLSAFAGTQAGSLFSKQNLSTVGVGMVRLPLFNGGRTRASIALAKQEREEALIAYKAAVLGALRDVEDALARFKAEDDRRGALAGSVSAARNSLTIAQQQYRVGMVTYVNILQADYTLLNSQDQLAQSDSQALTDLVSLYKALGGGWSVGGS